ncbi:MAG: hypothetical protein ACWA6X_00215 [Bauldia sp.]
MISPEYSADLDQRKSSVPARIWSTSPIGSPLYDRPPTLDLWTRPREVVWYIDTAIVSLTGYPSAADFARWRAAYGQQNVTIAPIEGAPPFARYRHRLTLQRPTEATIHDLIWRLGGCLTGWDIAIDLLGPAEWMRTNALLLDAFGFQPRRPDHTKRSVRIGEATIYWAPEKHPRNPILYADKPSKTGLGDLDGCCHLEPRYYGARAVHDARAFLARHGVIGLLERELTFKVLRTPELISVPLNDNALARRLGPEANRETLRQYASQDVFDRIRELRDQFISIGRWIDLIPSPQHIRNVGCSPRLVVDRKHSNSSLTATPTERSVSAHPI